MNVCVLIPPYIPSYFNAGHHLPIFQVGAFIRENYPDIQVTCIDAAALNYNWADICSLLLEKFDVIAVMNDFDSIDNMERFMYYVRELSSSTKTITFGRLSKQVPGFFKRYGIDGIHFSGDYESGISGFIEYVRNPSIQSIAGVNLKIDGKYNDEKKTGTYLEAGNWSFPKIEEIPYNAYDNLYKNDFNKFCGIPSRRELVVPVSRGCPLNCSFCDVTQMQGISDRRVSVKSAITYIRESFNKSNFEYVSFYAATFTLKRDWVVQLCNELIENKETYPWKCATTLYHLDHELIKLMAKSGCIRISVGIETLDVKGQKNLVAAKRGEKKLLEIAEICHTFGIELNCFIIVGLPGTDLEGTNYTIEKILSLPNTRVRPTVYTPFHELNENMDTKVVNKYNRQLFHNQDISGNDKLSYYKLLYNNKADRATKVTENIIKR